MASIDGRVDEIHRLVAQGVDALSGGRTGEAIRLLEQAAGLLRPTDDLLAPPLYEHLGQAYMQRRRAGPALRAFLRALDGDMTSREQSLRHAVTCFVNRLRFQDATRFLEAFEERFGQHPDGWTREYIEGRLNSVGRPRLTCGSIR